MHTLPASSEQTYQLIFVLTVIRTTTIVLSANKQAQYIDLTSDDEVILRCNQRSSRSIDTWL